MKVRMLRNPAAQCECRLVEGEEGDVSQLLGESLVKANLAICLDEPEPPKSVEAEAAWSGRRLPGGRCLVRAVSLGKDDARVRVAVADGLTVDLDAPQAGATYLVSATGQVRKVASGRM